MVTPSPSRDRPANFSQKRRIKWSALLLNLEGYTIPSAGYAAEMQHQDW